MGMLKASGLLEEALPPAPWATCARPSAAHSNIQRTQTSDQNRDLKASTTVRDDEDFDRYQNCMKSHSPFAHQTADGRVSISTGIVAANKANAYAAYSTRK